MENRGDGEAIGGSKRKRGGGPAADSDGADTDVSSSHFGVLAFDVEELLHTNFEELARQFPAFDAVYRRHPHLLPQDPPSTNNPKEEKGKRRGAGGGGGGGSKLQQAMASPEFRLELTRALLRRHWNLRLPAFDAATHLCPPVPNRYYLVKWLRSEVLRTAPRLCPGESTALEEPRLRGLDIGTGAAAIYALLLAATGSPNSSTEIFATDVDRSAVQQAQQNVEANRALLSSQWRSSVHVLAVPQCDRQRDPNLPLLMQQPRTRDSAMEMEEPSTEAHQPTSNSSDVVPKGPLRFSVEVVAEFLRSSQGGLDSENGTGDTWGLPPQFQLDVAFTNPPFFDVDEDRATRADGRDRTAMTHDEGCYPGGELAFLVDMVADGLLLHHQAHREPRDQPLGQHLSPETAFVPPLPPPRWLACMCGKKTTFTKVRGILRYVLGRARVMSTEFGPGFMTRWFLAWTMNVGSHRPDICSPLAAASSFRFRVGPIPFQSSRYPPTNPLAELEDRVREYCESFPGVNFVVQSSWHDGSARLGMTLRPQHPEICSDQDGTLPEPIRTVVSTMSAEERLAWLPAEGHFSVEIDAAVSKSELAVSVETFAHNKLGRSVVEKIQLQLESDLNRTNRKWRRILQRQQKEQQQQQQQQQRQQKEQQQQQQQQQQQSMQQREDLACVDSTAAASDAMDES